jgi:hypothetical protein
VVRPLRGGTWHIADFGKSGTQASQCDDKECTILEQHEAVHNAMDHTVK